MLVLERTKSRFPAVGKVQINGIIYESTGSLPKMAECNRQTGRINATGGLPTTHNVGQTLVILGLAPSTEYEVKYPNPYKETYTANSVGRVDIDPSKSNPFSDETIIKVGQYEAKIGNLPRVGQEPTALSPASSSIAIIGGQFGVFTSSQTANGTDTNNGSGVSSSSQTASGTDTSNGTGVSTSGVSSSSVTAGFAPNDTGLTEQTLPDGRTVWLAPGAKLPDEPRSYTWTN